MKRPLLCIAVILLPVVANTQSALEHHIWQDKGLFKADSHTAQAITGAIKLSGSPNFARRGSMMTLTFGNGRVVKLKEVGAAWRVWDDVGRERVTGEVSVSIMILESYLEAIIFVVVTLKTLLVSSSFMEKKNLE